MAQTLPQPLLATLKHRGAPSFWVERLAILPSLSADAKPLRDVTFKLGLNIIWSCPGSDSLDENQSGKTGQRAKGAGHAAGKTSLCRALRYVLGENEFGNEFMKNRLQNSKGLFTSYIAAEVWIGDTKWTVARPVNKIKADHAYQSATIEQALTGEVTPQSYKHDFLPALNQATTGRLKVTDLDQNRRITWNHLLESLSRDQEAHLAALHQWRSAAANSDPLKTSDSDRCLIMRCLFGLADGGESSLLNQREKLAEENRQSERNISASRHNKSRDMAKLGIEAVQEISDLGPQELFLFSVREDAQKNINTERETLNSSIEKLGIETLTEARDQAASHYNRLTSRFMERWEHYNDEKLQLVSYRKEHKDSPEPLDKCAYIKARAKHGGQKGICSVPYWMAENNCDLFKQCGVPDLTNQDNINLENATLEGQFRWNIGNLRQELKAQIPDLRAAKNPLTQIEKRLREARTRKSQLESKIRNLPNQLTESERAARNLLEALEEIEASQKSITNNKAAIKNLDEELEAIRKRSKWRQIVISDIFNHIIKFIINKDLKGTLTFTNIENNATLELETGGELDSAAFRAIRCLAYDYAALLSSYLDSEHCCHPRFVLHDSPRESDLEPGIYRDIFNFVAQIESLHPDSFQAIITTTEPPPAEYQKHPHLRLELASTPKEKRFYCENL
jgi:predicted nuclease with TOPRIM domain